MKSVKKPFSFLKVTIGMNTEGTEETGDMFGKKYAEFAKDLLTTYPK